MSGLKVPGPFWLGVEPDGSYTVKAHNARVVARYPAHQSDLAEVHCRKLQRQFTSEERKLRDAARDLLEVAKMVVEASDLAGFSGPIGDAARAAIAKATGQ